MGWVILGKFGKLFSFSPEVMTKLERNIICGKYGKNKLYFPQSGKNSKSSFLEIKWVFHVLLQAKIFHLNLTHITVKSLSAVRQKLDQIALL